MPADRKRILCGSISVSYDLWLPYSSGCLISYARHAVDTSHVDWLEPLYKWLPDDELDARLAEADVLCLTCYIWNHEYNLHAIRRFKNLNPNGIAIMGGPEIPLDVSEHAEFAAARSEVDAFVMGPGEQVFAEIVRRVSDPVYTWPQCFGYGYSNVTGRMQQVKADEMPQPYVDGIFDGIVAREARIKASFETNRGCPYKCAFCDWGGQANDVVTKVPMDQVKAAIDWIYARASVTEIEILDANFGMHRRDLETVSYMLDAKNRFGNNPTVSYSGLVKNGSQYLPEIIRIIHNHLGAERRHLKLSFQTHSKETLRTVLRDNIDNNRLLNLLDNLREDGIKVSSEMIIGLPGETAESWLESQATDYRHGIGFMRTYILNLVRNTRLYEKDYREQHGIKSKRILIPYEVKKFDKSTLINNPGLVINHADQFESSEIIHECNSFDLAELVLMYRYFWYYHNFFNSRALQGSIAHLDALGFDIAAQARMFMARLPVDGLFAKLLAKQDSVVGRIYAPEQETILNDYSSYRFFSGSLRTDDLYQFIMHRDQLAEEFCHIFDDVSSLRPHVESDISGWLGASTETKILSNRLLGMGSSVRA